MLSNRNRMRLQRFGRHFRKRQNCRNCTKGELMGLDLLPEGTNAVVICNQNLSTIERGLYIGMQVSVFRNEQNEPNIIVAVGDARYVLDRRVAKEIRVKTC